MLIQVELSGRLHCIIMWHTVSTASSLSCIGRYATARLQVGHQLLVCGHADNVISALQVYLPAVSVLERYRIVGRGLAAATLHALRLSPRFAALPSFQTGVQHVVAVYISLSMCLLFRAAGMCTQKNCDNMQNFGRVCSGCNSTAIR